MDFVTFTEKILNGKRHFLYSGDLMNGEKWGKIVFPVIALQLKIGISGNNIACFLVNGI